MKKKRLYLVMIIAALAALFGGSGGVAWGQAYSNRYVTRDGKVELRRKDATPVPGVPGSAYIGIVPNNGPTNVGGVQFGAGESVTIGASNAILLPKTLTPNGNTAPAVYIGSNYSENIVMNNYNAGGKASGFLNITATAPQHYMPGLFM